MYSSISRLSSSLIPRFTRCQGELTASRSFSVSRMPSGHLETFKHGINSSENVGRGRVLDHVLGLCGMPGIRSGIMHVKTNLSIPFSLRFRSSTHSAGWNDNETGRNSRSMNFVRGIIEEDGRGNRWGSQFPQYNIENNADVVHIKLMRNNTFVTVTDSKGNKKLGASAGSLPEMKGGAKLSRYAAEATAEHVGRMSRNFGLKSVVMKVKGFTYFKKKKQAILSWKDGFTNSRVGENPVVYIEDTTRKPHNGCRLRKQRRV